MNRKGYINKKAGRKFMRGKKITLIFTAFFYIFMLIFSVSARKIHVASLTREKVTEIEFETFEIEEQEQVEV